MGGTTLELELFHAIPAQLCCVLIDLTLCVQADKSGGTPLSKKGYLQKGPFPQDGGISVSMKVSSAVHSESLVYFMGNNIVFTIQTCSGASGQGTSEERPLNK